MPLGAATGLILGGKWKDEKAVASLLGLTVPGGAGGRGAMTHFPNKRRRQSQNPLRQTHRAGCECQTCT